MLTASAARCLAVSVLCRAGVPEAAAEETADILVWADVHGIHSHGLMRLPRYWRRLAAGGIAPDAELELVATTGSVSRFHGHDGLGHWQVSRAAKYAAERAGSEGIHLVGVSRSSHCGALGAHLWPIMARGCAGLLLSNGPPAVAPWGTGTAVLSTGPLAVGVPTGDGNVVVDLATTNSARGRVVVARERGESLPEGIAIDREGRPTVDPDAALQGSLAPIGGHKGFAIGVAIELLTGGLFGDQLACDVVDMFDPEQDAVPQGACHFVLAIDPDAAGGGLVAQAMELAARVRNAGGHVPGDGKRHPDDIDDDDVALDDPVLEKQLLELAGY